MPLHTLRYFKDDVPCLFETLAALAARTTLVAVMHREGYGEVFAQAAAARGWECVPAGPKYCGPLAGGGGYCSLLLLTAASGGRRGGTPAGVRPGAIPATPKATTTGHVELSAGASSSVLLIVTPDDAGGVTTALQFY